MALILRGGQEACSSSTSSTSFTSRYSYDVFLSFRGKDTRKTFTDHLYTSFLNAGFRTFRDDDELERGEGIKPELEKAIQQSRISVIVFSKDYASSRWCLDELVIILKRKNSTSDHVVLPVFYDLDPSHVRKQTGSYAEAFARHQKTRPFDTVKQWREALAEAADLAGMVLPNEPNGHESKFIKKIVKVIEDKLRRTPLGVDPYLIGIDSRVKKISMWLQDGSNDVGVLVISGMRGIGKTTIAKFAYNLNFTRFERGSFLENIREISEQCNGLIQIQKRLLHDITNGRKVKIHNISEGKAKIEDAISSKRVLLVLDDVDHMDQLDGVLRMQDRCHPGSKIIITTSNAGLLNVHHHVVKVHNVETLDYNEALELFSLHAFGQYHPIESYMDHSKRLVHHCAGLPLALKILGSSLSGRNIAVWESELSKLEAIPDGQILKKLKISYDSLQDSHDQELFLHIACFFIGMDKDFVVRILDDCDFFTDVGIQNLIDRYLVIIDEYHKLQMHHMIRDMGRGIVRLESKEPGERSRLWHHKDSFKVLTEKTGTRKIEGLVLNMQMYPEYTPSRNSNDRLVLEINAFSRMHKLRILKLSYVQLNGSYKGFPTGLRWSCWLGFPFDSLPSSFPLESLVALEMCYSSLKQVWKGSEYFPSLKILNLSHSSGLIETPDFSPVPNLERLILKDCASLVDVHESIGNLERLIYLNVEDCKNIRKLPKNISMLTFLETLTISGCSNLNVFPTEISKMTSLKVLQADGVPIHQLLTAIMEGTLWLRKKIEISWASYLPRNLVNLSLRKCNLSDEDFPRDFGNLPSLQILDLSGNPICGLPDCVRGLRGLHKLCLEACMTLKSLLRLPNVGELTILDCESLEKVTFQSLSDSRICPVMDSNYKLVEVEYWYKLEPIEKVDAELTNLLGLSNLKSTETITMKTVSPFTEGREIMHPIQGLYEYGIFSTFLPGDSEVPGSFSHKSRGSSISFTVPLLPNPRIRGLNFFCVYAMSNSNDSPKISVNDDLPHPIITKVFNKSKGLKWIYGSTFFCDPGDGQDVIWLSHWKFGNKLEGGDEVTFTVLTRPTTQVKEWGIELVYYEQEEKMSNQHNITEPFYPCVISGDLSCNLISGTYVLCCLMDVSIRDLLSSVWFNYITGDFDEITDKEEEQQGDCTLEAQRSSNSSGGRSWKKVVMIMASVFFLSLPLVTRSSLFQRKKRQASGAARTTSCSEYIS